MWVLKEPNRARAAEKSSARETLDSLVWALVIFVLVRTFAFQAFQIPSSSMEKTLLPGDFLFVNKLLYGAKLPFTDIRLPGLTHPKPGDIIVFQFPQDPKTDYIKRCVAVAGQTVEVRDKQLYVDGVLKNEAYAIHVDPRTGERQRDFFGPYTVPPGNIFMMGDNRDQSYDSRFWGPVDLKLIRGQAWVTYFSISWDDKAAFPQRLTTIKRIRPERMFRWIR
ncbi:MAG: signal peptidase I [Candidatus Eisenbacteria bacterium]|nr:signal peptidase I [Candidatus Eisenbacteria bacterium]